MSSDIQRCLAHRTAEEITKPGAHDNRTSPKLRSSVLLPSQFSGRQFRMIPLPQAAASQASRLDGIIP